MKTEFSDFLPVGIRKKTALITAAAGCGIAAGASIIRFCSVYFYEYISYNNGYNVLFGPFASYIEDTMTEIHICIYLLIISGIYFHLRHYADKSIYTLKRCGKPFEIYKRCWFFPAVNIVILILLKLALYTLYYFIYMKFTPPGFAAVI